MRHLTTLLVALAAGCAAPVQDYAENFGWGRDEPVTAEPDEWFALQGGALLRDPDRPDGVDDGGAVDLVGGWDLVGDRLRFGLEGQVGWSGHDTNWTPEPGRSNDDLSLLTVGLGVRLWWRPAPGHRFAAYVRAGGFGQYTLDDVGDEFVAGVPADYDETVYGGYAGGGIEFRYAPGCYLGPFYTHYWSEDGRLELSAIGLATRFRF